MKRNYLFSILILAMTAASLLARGFGGGLHGRGDAAAMDVANANLGGGHILRSRGFWDSVLSSSNDDYDDWWDVDLNPPGLVNYGSPGLGGPTGKSSAQAVNREMSMAPPQANVTPPSQVFASEASSLGIHVGGFSAGEFGPMRTGGGFPTDLGMHQTGTMARGGNSAADLRVQGNLVRRNFKNYDAFGPDWYRAHPGSWSLRSRSSVWQAATWDELNSWFGNEWDAFPYDYGTDLTYEKNIVYQDGRAIANANLYNDRAVELARIGERALNPSDSTGWRSLGVFEAIPPGQKSSNMLFQLALNKDGIIRGNYYDTRDRNVQLIEGSIDKNVARSVWVVADKKDILFDTSLYNLTRREAAILVHLGKDKIERWVLVRLQQ